MREEIKKPRIVIVTGAESTGKSVLTRQLAEEFSAPFYPEYAREFLEKSGHPYTRDEVVHIAHTQVAQMENALASGEEWVFFDTWLIITKVWMEVVYGEAPPFINRALSHYPASLYLLCDTDIPWEPDPLRENGGENREILSGIYRNHLESLGARYSVVSGKGEERRRNALQIIRKTFNIPLI